jgi:hypothetical protein
VARFEHNKYPSLTLQDAEGVWARFTPEKRTFGEHTIHVGVLETSDTALARRLRDSSDPDLVEVEAPKRGRGKTAEKADDSE